MAVPKSRRWVVMLAGAAALHGLLLVSLQQRWLTRLFNDTRNRPGPGADFFAVYHAGRQVLTGHPPYDPRESPQVTPPYFAPFRYPPGVAYTLGAAVALLRPWVAYGVWLAILEALLLVSAWGVRFLIADERDRTYVQCAWLLATPLLVELWMGQFTFLAAMLTWWAFLAWQRGRARLGALAWAVACAIKLFPLALAPWLLRERRWGALALAGLLLGLGLTWFFAYPDDFAPWLGLNFSRPQAAEMHAGNLGLHVLVYDLVTWGNVLNMDEWAPISRGLSVALALTAAAAMILPRRADPRIAVAMALWLLPLLSKDAWEHHYVVALPALALMVAAWADAPRWRGLAFALFAVIAAPTWLALIQDVPSTWYPSRDWSWSARMLYHAPKPLAALAAFAACAAHQFARRAQQHPPP